MNLRFLETFIWVARLRHFRLAAAKLHTTPASVSSRIAALEEELGVRLFVRDAREVQLTDQGRQALVYAETIVAQVRTMRLALADPATLVGQVRIGVIGAVVHTWLAELVHDLAAAYPKLDVELTSDTTRKLCEQLQKGQLDVVLQSARVLDDSVRNRVLVSYPVHWIAASSWQASAGPLPLEALARERIITPPRSSPMHHEVLSLLHAHGIRDARINCVTSATAMIRLAREGFGVSTLPAVLIKDELDAGQLVMLPVAEPLAPLEVIASWRVGAGQEWAERVVDMARATVQRFLEAVGPAFAHLPDVERADAAASASPRAQDPRTGASGG